MRRVLIAWALCLGVIFAAWQVSLAQIVGEGVLKAVPAAGPTSQVAVTFAAGSANGFAINNASIGIQSSTYDTAATPVELTFNGGQHGFSISAGTTITSDWVNLQISTSAGTVFSRSAQPDGANWQDYSARQSIPSSAITNAVGTVLIDFDTPNSASYSDYDASLAYTAWYITPVSTYYNQASPSGSWSSGSFLYAVMAIQSR